MVGMLSRTRLAVFVILFLLFNPVGAQNYIRYQQIFNRLDEDVLSDQFKSLEQEKRNNSLEINRRKSKTANSEIVLE
jgi:hypothetical protein